MTPPIARVVNNPRHVLLFLEVRIILSALGVRFRGPALAIVTRVFDAKEGLLAAGAVAFGAEIGTGVVAVETFVPAGVEAEPLLTHFGVSWCLVRGR